MPSTQPAGAAQCVKRKIKSKATAKARFLVSLPPRQASRDQRSLRLCSGQTGISKTEKAKVVCSIKYAFLGKLVDGGS